MMSPRPEVEEDLRVCIARIIYKCSSSAAGEALEFTTLYRNACEAVRLNRPSMLVPYERTMKESSVEIDIIFDTRATEMALQRGHRKEQKEIWLAVIPLPFFFETKNHASDSEEAAVK